MGPRQGRHGLARAADLMAQVLKPAVRARIQDAALRCFATHGYGGTSMAEIAAAAQTAPANLYRYYASKEALFEAVVPADLAVRHDSLLDTRIAALAQGTADKRPLPQNCSPSGSTTAWQWSCCLTRPKAPASPPTPLRSSSAWSSTP